MTTPALLVLENGTVFNGRSIGVEGETVGEVVFNTAMTGYQEILTDPSYFQQLVTLTYPHIGNVGTNSEDQESDRVYASGLIIRDLPRLQSSWRDQRPLSSYLTDNQVVAIADIDTRQLTRILREQGAQRGCIVAGAGEREAALELARGFPGLKGADLAAQVTTQETYEWSKGSWRSSPTTDLARYDVVAYDFGVKRNILQLLADCGCHVTVVPATTPAVEVLARQPDGVFLSNGPGDPEPCDYAVAAISEIVDAGIPTFGICLGLQLLGLAVGASTLKMKLGHHGANHPVQELSSGKVLITSQNHGFAVDESTLPDVVVATHRSLFDGTLQGLHHRTKPAFGFQGHPEASPGPHDVRPLFDHFIDLMRDYQRVSVGN